MAPGGGPFGDSACTGWAGDEELGFSSVMVGVGKVVDGRWVRSLAEKTVERRDLSARAVRGLLE